MRPICVLTASWVPIGPYGLQGRVCPYIVFIFRAEACKNSTLFLRMGGSAFWLVPRDRRAETVFLMVDTCDQSDAFAIL